MAVLSVLISVLIVVSLLVLTVASHEAGHTIAAMTIGISFESVEIGIPLPPEIDLTFKGRTLKLRPWLQKKFTVKGKAFSIQPWLLGGKVSIKEEELLSREHWKTALIAAAGPLTNIALGLAPAILAFGPKVGAEVAGEFASASAMSIKMLLTGQVGFDLLVGPIGLIAICANIVRIEPILGTLFVWLLLNIAIGVVNLAPIPVLDGGVIVFGPLRRTSSALANRVAKFLNTGFEFLLFGGLIALTIKDVLTLF